MADVVRSEIIQVGSSESQREDDDTALAVWEDAARDSALVLRAHPGAAFRVHSAALPDPVDARLVLAHDPSGPRARSYRLLRHRLLAAGDPQVIAVTSAVPGEGKTTLAANLALCLAEDCPGSVLLLDANLRRPAIAQVFGLDTLGEILDLDGAEPFVVVAIDGTRLHVALAPSSNALDARLDRVQLGEILVELRQSYHYVVIDAAAVKDAADAHIAAELSDGVILALRAHATRRMLVASALEEIQPAPVLGVVLLDA